MCSLLQHEVFPLHANPYSSSLHFLIRLACKLDLNSPAANAADGTNPDLTESNPLVSPGAAVTELISSVPAM